MDRHIQDNVDNFNFIKRFLFGGLGGICGKTIIAPIERIKYIFVTSSRYFTFKDGLHEAQDIITKTGFLKLWRGNLLNILRVFPYAALVRQKFFKKIFESKFYSKQVNSKIHALLCGSLSGIVASSIMYPMDFMRTQLAVRHNDQKSMNQILKHIKKDYGIYALYRGIRPNIVGIVLYKEVLNLLKHNQSIYTGVKLNGIAAAVASLVGQISTYPLDTIKRRMMIHEKHTITVSEIVKLIYQKNGFFRGFYKGVSLNLIKGPIANSVAFMVKEKLNKKLIKH